jgi:hypothetical protein
MNASSSLSGLCVLASVLALGVACSGNEGYGVPGGSDGDSDDGAAGGATGSGGSGAGGSAAGGGTGTPPTGEPHVAVDECDETSSSAFTLGDQYAKQIATMDGGKSYAVTANWWAEYNNQDIEVTGNAFKIVGNAGGGQRGEGAPAGFPTIFAGSYAGQTTTGVDLPRQVSSLTRVPTVFRTNGTGFAQDYYNATYDVWFTASEAGVPEGQYSPGAGGAFLMVWTFKPTSKRPRGPNTAQYQDVVVPGVTGTWDVWVDDTDPPCISYVATVPTDDLGFDLKNFIDDSVTQGYGLTEEMYLSIVFAGFEVWDGGDGLEAKEFCVDVE